MFIEIANNIVALHNIKAVIDSKTCHGYSVLLNDGDSFSIATEDYAYLKGALIGLDKLVYVKE